MTDVYLAYRASSDRKALVRRLATILRAYEISVWWDYGLEAGESYRARITKELANARIVAPLWCAESVVSRWVLMEAELGRDKLMPVRLQQVAPPDAFEAIQAADLVGWDGAVGNPRIACLVRRICRHLGRVVAPPADMIEELQHLPALVPLPAVPNAPIAAPVAAAVSDYAFWKSEWDAHNASEDLVALRAIVASAPRYFAEQAAARLIDIESRRRAERHRLQRGFQVNGRVHVDAEFIRGAADGWFEPGAGRTEWFADDGAGPLMVVVPAGSYRTEPDGERSGGAGTPRLVTFSTPFAVGIGPVTRAEFAAFAVETRRNLCLVGTAGADEDLPCWGEPDFEQTDEHPAVGISWDDAQAYVAWLSARTGKRYRLLTEDEWAYCCRAGTRTAYAYGDILSTADANFGCHEQGTTAVGHFPPNAWGLHDMHGNVLEWCGWDDQSEAGMLRDDALVWQAEEPTHRILCGGSWRDPAPRLRASTRRLEATRYRSDDVGFRVARDL